MADKATLSGMIRASSSVYEKSAGIGGDIRMLQPRLVRLQRLEQERLDRYGRFGRRTEKR